MTTESAPSFAHPNPWFCGYYPEATLPIKAGDSVVIPKGTPVRHRNKVTITQRARTVRVHHVISGMSRPAYDCKRYEDMKLPAGIPDHCMVPVHNPCVVWIGEGGYWSEVDINFLPAAVDPGFLKSDVRATYFRMAIAAESVRLESTDMLRFYDVYFQGHHGVRGIRISEIRAAIKGIRYCTADANVIAACDMILETV